MPVLRGADNRTRADCQPAEARGRCRKRLLGSRPSPEPRSSWRHPASRHTRFAPALDHWCASALAHISRSVSGTVACAAGCYALAVRRPPGGRASGDRDRQLGHELGRARQRLLHDSTAGRLRHDRSCDCDADVRGRGRRRPVVRTRSRSTASRSARFAPGRGVVCIAMTNRIPDGPHVSRAPSLRPARDPPLRRSPSPSTRFHRPRRPARPLRLHGLGRQGRRDHEVSVVNLNGTAPAKTPVQIWGNAQTGLGGATSDADGSWAATTVSLRDGTYSMNAIALDSAGNRSALSSPARSRSTPFARRHPTSRASTTLPTARSSRSAEPPGRRRDDHRL